MVERLPSMGETLGSISGSLKNNLRHLGVGPVAATHSSAARTQALGPGSWLLATERAS